MFLSFFAGQALAVVWNNPYPAAESTQKIYYSSFSEQPKTLDPARSYSANEYQFILQVCEPLLTYDYYLRPYQQIPLTAEAMPEISTENQEIIYRINIRPGIFYQPHPAFAKTANDHHCYLNLDDDFLEKHNISRLADFKHTGSRELTADDYVYQIKRLANPAVSSPIYGLMSEHIAGFAEFAASLPVQKTGFVDLRAYPMTGVKSNGKYQLEIRLKNIYPQFIFWLSMPFFAPVPWEADAFYAQPGLAARNISFDWYPVGTGAFMLSENNPNQRMVLEKNPNWRTEYFPLNKDPADESYARYAGEKIPLVDKAIFTLEKESIPRWNKFLQGYYDQSGIGTDSYDQAVKINALGEPELSAAMKEKKMRLVQTTDLSIYYMGFNMLDPVVGGNSERARKLRLAISRAINYEENIVIFFNGRGQAAQGPLPPGIFGFKEGREGINPYVYEWRDNKPQRMNINAARQMMIEAGYPQGIDPATGKALILHYDVPVAGTPDDKSQLDWMRKQFAQIGIDLDIRGTQYNRFQDKMRSGNAQIFSWGWNADYPDPENFLFMLYGANGKVAFGGENAANYSNPVYDKLFDRMKNGKNDAVRQQLIDKMVEIVRHDSPWVWGIYTENLILSQQWVSPVKPNTLGSSQLKYVGVDVALRNQSRILWNQAVLWPILWVVLLLALCAWPLIITYRRRENAKAIRELP